jgi:glycosyltransferase involved in cell wall biosynthesis
MINWSAFDEDISIGMSAARVLFVSHVGRLGGAERSLVDLIYALDRRQYAAHVVLPGAGELSEQLGEMGIAVDFCPGLRVLGRSGCLGTQAAQLLHLLVGATMLRGLIRRHTPAIVHANSTTAALYATCPPAGIVPPTLWHFRDLVLPRLIGRMLSRRCVGIIAPSRACASLVAATGHATKIVVIPNGIEVAKPLGTARVSVSMTPDRIVVAMIGQSAPWKGHMLALEVASLVAACQSNVDFLLVADDRMGGSPSAADLRRAVDARGLRGRVTVLGPVASVDEVLSQADIVMHPAFPEPAGRVVLEAMAYGHPVVAPDGPHGPAEVIRHGVDGLLVARRDAVGLAKAVLDLAVDSSLRDRMGIAARARAAVEFDRVLMARRIEALYASILNDPAVARRNTTSALRIW